VIDLARLVSHAWEYLESVCARLPMLAVIVCTAPSRVGHRVRGLRLGADDWLTKPCHPEEVIARIEAVIRRRGVAAAAAQAPVRAGELEICQGSYQAVCAGRPLELTRREFDLLAVLAQSAGQVIERADIYQRVWGYAMAHGDRSVDVYVRELRHKLERASPRWSYIHTHFGIGYRFAPETDGDAAKAPPAIAAPAPELVPA
jgi:DNA-binding response OmpR family regulator